MMQKLKAAVAGICCLFGSSASGNSILEIQTGLRALHQVQDEIARGVPDASQLQNAVLGRLTEIFESSPNSFLSGQEAQSALAELALSGGDRTRMANLIRLSQGSGELEPLLSIVQFYLEADMTKAALAIEEAEGMEDGASGIEHYLALAKGTAWLESDLPKAREAFEQALLDAPGTLVEEVALRRLAVIGLQQKDADLFVRCAILYSRRYAKSPFAPEFWSGFADGIQMVSNSKDIERIGDVVSLLPATTGRPLLFRVAKEFLSNGKVSFAALFANRLRDSMNSNNKALNDAAEVQVLEILVETHEFSDPGVLAALNSADQMLTGSDIGEIAKHVSWNIHKPLVASVMEKSSAEAIPAGTPNDFAGVDQILTRAQEALGPSEKVKTQ